ncbi:hypothetical protein ABZ897_62260 [Nonomuraea sp. NPDC046802]|uniref:hypothetical protein n=1 Tax=Nonomuraea sp. NPDC046802 TaxID=3154919 RepID=UPI0033C58A9B
MIHICERGRLCRAATSAVTAPPGRLVLTTGELDTLLQVLEIAAELIGDHRCKRLTTAAGAALELRGWPTDRPSHFLAGVLRLWGTAVATGVTTPNPLAPEPGAATASTTRPTTTRPTGRPA